MEINPNRSAKITDRKGHTAPQGVLPGNEFDYLVKTEKKLEKPTEEKVLIIQKVFSLYEELSGLPKDKTQKEFILLTRAALARSIYGKENEEMALVKEVGGNYADGYSFVRIYSNPKTKGIHILIQEPSKKITNIDLTKGEYKIHVVKSYSNGIKDAGISDFLEYDPNLDNPDLQEALSVGRELDKEIFKGVKPESTSSKPVENGR